MRGKYRGLIVLSIVLTLVMSALAADLNCTIVANDSCSGSYTPVLYLQNDSGGNTNAHSALANASSGYAYVLCCGDTAGSTISSSCTDGTTFLKLWNQTNSHVEYGNGTNYNYGACIKSDTKDINCSWGTSSCTGDYDCLVSLGSSELDDQNTTNAHVGNCGDYQTNVCCSLSAANNNLTLTNVLLTSIDGSNTTYENLTVTYDLNPSTAKTIIDWRVNDTSIAILNMPFEYGDNSTKANDWSTFGNDATVNGATFNTTGGFDGKGAYSFDNDYLTISNSDYWVMGDKNYSVSLWFKPSANTSLDMLIGTYQGGVYGGWGIWSDSGSLRGVASDGGGWDVNMIGGSINNDTWYHAAMTRSGTSWKLYLDGKEIDSTTLSLTVSDSGGNLELGESYSSYTYQGLLDEVLIFNRSLSPEQIKNIYLNQSYKMHYEVTAVNETWEACVTAFNTTTNTSTTCSNNLTINSNVLYQDNPILNATDNPINSTTANLTLYNQTTINYLGGVIKNLITWNINDVPLITALISFEGHDGDETSTTKNYAQGTTGTVNGATWNSTGGYDGFGAYNFDGINDYISFTRTSDLEPKNDFTITFWVKPGSSQVSDAGIFNTRWSSSNYNYGINYQQYDANTNQYRLEYREANTNRYSSALTLTADEWNFVTIVRDGPDIYQYLNGVLTQTDYGNNAGGVIDYYASQTYFYLGKTTYGSYEWNGTLDEFTIYNKTLSKEQIKSLYQNNTNKLTQLTTKTGDQVQGCVYLVSDDVEGSQKCSNNTTIQPDLIISTIINSTKISLNSTNENITAQYTITQDANSKNKTINYDWYLNGKRLKLLDLMFEYREGFPNYLAYDAVVNGTTKQGAHICDGCSYDSSRAMIFDGVDDYVDFGSHGYLRPVGDFSFSFWFNPGSVQQSYAPVFSERKAGFSNVYGVNFGSYDTVDDTYYFYYREGGVNRVSSSIVFPSGVWSHVVVVRDGKNVYQYVNGVLNTSDLDHNSGGVIDYYDSTPNFYLGREGYRNTYWNGSLDDFVMWNISLTADQVKALYENKTNTIIFEQTKPEQNWSSCLTIYDNYQNVESCTENITIVTLDYAINQSNPLLNSSDGTNSTLANITIYNQSTYSSSSYLIKNIIDWKLNGADLQLLNLPFEARSDNDEHNNVTDYFRNISGNVHGANWLSNNGYDGKGAYSFDGVDDYVDFGSHGYLRPVGDFSFSFWFNPGSVQQSYAPVFSERKAGFSNVYGVNFGSYDTVDDTYYFYYREGGVNRVSSSIVFPSGVWSHVVVVRDGKNVYQYVNGVLNTSDLDHNSGGVIDYYDSTPNFYLGYEGFRQTEWNGSLDDFVMWNISLTADQVKALYENKTNTLVDDMLYPDQTYQACIMPNDGYRSGTIKCSNTITILSTITGGSLILNATDNPNNTTRANLTLYNGTTTSTQGAIKNIITWKQDGNYLADVYYPFEYEEGEDQSITTRDYSENYDLTVSGATWSSSSGYDGWGAYTFDGVNDYMYKSYAGPTGDLTVMFWVKPDATQTANSAIFSYTGSTTDYGINLVQPSANTNNYVFQYYEGNANRQSTTVNIPAGSWTHYAVVRRGENIFQYKNGVLVASDWELDSRGAIDYNVYTLLNVGRAEYLDYEWKGVLDEFAIYDRALSAEQINLIYQNRTNIIGSSTTNYNQVWEGCANFMDGVSRLETCANITINPYSLTTHDTPLLVASDDPTNSTDANLTVSNQSSINSKGLDFFNVIDWRKTNVSLAKLYLPFEARNNQDEDLYTTDYTSTSETVKVVGATWNSTGGYQDSGAYIFDGSNDYLSISSSATDGLTQFTFSLWLKSTDTGSSATYYQRPTILGITSSGTGSNDFGITTNNGYIGYWHGLESGVDNNYLSTTTQVNDDNWHLITVTNNGSEIKLYVDGVNESTTSSGLSLGSLAFYVGGSDNAGSFTYPFSGTIDELRLYDYALTGEQILALYNNRTDLIVSQETEMGEQWSACITPVDDDISGTTKCSNALSISINYTITQGTPIINNTNAYNDTYGNLTVTNQSTVNGAGKPTKNIVDWRIINSSYTLLNLPFEARSEKDENIFTNDFSKSDATCNVSGATWSSSSGYDGWGAYTFDGTDDYIATDAPKAYNDFSFGGWFKTSSTHQVDGEYSSGTYGVTGQKYLFRPNQEDANAGAGLSVGTNGVTVYEHGTNYMPSIAVYSATIGSGWTHVMVVYKDKTPSIYINGTLVHTGLTSTKNYVYSPTIIGGGSYGYFEGTADELMVFNRSLTPEQVLALYQNRTDFIHNNQTIPGYYWQACITPVDDFITGETNCSTTTYINYVLQHGTPILNSTDNPINSSNGNLTVHNQSTFSTTNSIVKNIIDWRKTGEDLILLDAPFENNMLKDESNYVYDYSEHENTGSVNGATWNSSGGFDGFGAYVFDGVDDYLTFPLSSSLQPVGDVSFSFWVKPTGSITTNSAVFSTTSTSNYYGYNFVHVGGNNYQFKYYIGSNKASGSVNLPVDVWSHVVVVRDGKNVFIYRDGLLNVSSLNNNGGGDLSYAIVGDLNLGRSIYSTLEWNGTLDEFVIWNKSLSAEQVKLLYENKTNTIFHDELTPGEEYQACITPIDKIDFGEELCSNTITINNLDYAINQTKPILNATDNPSNTTNANLTVYVNGTSSENFDLKNIIYWRYGDEQNFMLLNTPFEARNDNDESNTIKDYINFNDGTVYGASWDSSGGFDGFGAYFFDGVDDYLTFPLSSSLQPVGDVSFSFWVKPTGSIVTNSAIFSTTSSSNDYGYNFVHVGSNNYRFEYYDTTSRASGSVNLPVDVWSHVVVVRDGKNVFIYRDGNLNVSSLNNNGGGDLSYASIESLNLGRSTYYYYEWSGTIDEFVIWNTSLSAEQVKALYNNKTNLLVSQETNPGESWEACVVLNDGYKDSAPTCSNNLTIASLSSALSQGVPVLNTTDHPLNTTNANLTLNNISTYSSSGYVVSNYVNWLLNGNKLTLLNAPFENLASGDESNVVFDLVDNNGTNYGATYSETSGFDGGGAYSFDGVDDYLTFPLSSSLQPVADVSFSFWVKPTGSVATSSAIFSTTATSTDYGYNFVHVGSNNYRFEYYLGSNKASGSVNLPVDVWSHVVVVRDGTDIQIYRNGTLEVNNVAHNNGGDLSYASVGDLNLGRALYGSYEWGGTLDDFVIWNTSLSAEQVKALYENKTQVMTSSMTTVGDVWQGCITPHDTQQFGTKKCSNNITILSGITQGTPVLNATDNPVNSSYANLTVYNQSTTGDGAIKNIIDWLIDDASIMLLNMPFEYGDNSTFSKDYSGFSNNATVTGATFNATGGFDGFGAYSFDGNDYLTIFNSETVDSEFQNLGNNNNYSISAWIKTSGGTTAGSYWRPNIVLVELREEKTIGAHVAYSFGVSNGYVELGRADAYTSSNEREIGTVTVNDGSWHYVVASVNDDVVNFYVDGTLDVSRTYTTATGDCSVSATNSNLFIGARATDAGAATSYFPGDIDEVQLYNRTLSAEQVLVLYNNRTDLIVSQETSVGDVWQACMTPVTATETGSTSCSNNVTIILSTPDAPTLSYPANNNNSVFERTPNFDWGAVSGATNYTFNLTQTTCPDIYVEGITDSNYITSELCVDEVYNWSVRACNENGCSAWSSEWNFTIASTIGITFITNNTNFGILNSGETENTSDDSPAPLNIVNDGNIPIDVQINATSLFSSVSMNTSYYQFKARENEANSYNTTTSTTTWTNMSLVVQYLVRGFNYTDVKDSAYVDLKIMVPNTESASSRSSTIKVIGEAMT